MDQKEVTQLIRASILEGNKTKVAELIADDKGRLHIMTTFGSWLHVAARHGNIDIVKYLVESGIDVNLRGGIAGGAPIHLAASQGHVAIVDFLLTHGAQMDVSEPERNPLFGAIYGGHTAVAKLLIDRGIDTKVKYTGKTMKNMDALAFAHEWGRSDIAELLKAK